MRKIILALGILVLAFAVIPGWADALTISGRTEATCTE